jgi:hypothetical protein
MKDDRKKEMKKADKMEAKKPVKMIKDNVVKGTKKK